MSDIQKKFYNLFWQNKSCQNLFLMSKEELLDSKLFNYGFGEKRYSKPRITISNVDANDFIGNTIKIRNENNNINNESSLTSKFNYFKPLIENILKKSLDKPINKLLEGLEKDPESVIAAICNIIKDEDKEQTGISFLKEYGFVGRNILTFEEVSNLFQKNYIFKKNSELFSEENIILFLDGVKHLKDFYVNLNNEVLYNTNQILVNALSREDNFESRIKLFNLLYECNIISSSIEDALIECTNCPPGTYKGSFQLKVSPNKLNNLKCPVCASELAYYVPYKLHEDIYQIVKEKDGLLQNALCNILESRGIVYTSNRMFLNDIEIDCVYENNGAVNFVEIKMYKLSTSENKLKSKIREHFGKLSKDISRIKEIDTFQNKTIRPILLVNILDTNLLKELESELKEINKDEVSQTIIIANIELIYG